MQGFRSPAVSGGDIGAVLNERLRYLFAVPGRRRVQRRITRKQVVANLCKEEIGRRGARGAHSQASLRKRGRRSQQLCDRGCVVADDRPNERQHRAIIKRAATRCFRHALTAKNTVKLTGTTRIGH